jgi:hypothetical protein
MAHTTSHNATYATAKAGGTCVYTNQVQYHSQQQAVYVVVILQMISVNGGAHVVHSTTQNRIRQAVCHSAVLLYTRTLCCCDA